MNSKKFNLNAFIDQQVINRSESLFSSDLTKHQNKLNGFINDSRLLVIGGAGSIGSSYIKAVLKFKPQTLIVVDKNENSLAELIRDLRSSPDIYIPNEILLYPFDYASASFKRLIENQPPFDLVANFAAHKHVRSEKDDLSIQAMLENNVINLHTLLDQLKEKPPKVFFSVSSDKATNPANVMGASKKLMEKLMFSYTDFFKVRSARFANVAFSDGSLLFSFLKRFEKSQPFVSPNDVKRYFVSPKESGQLCLLASIVPDDHSISFPKLAVSKMKKFSDIALALLNDLGYEPILCESEIEAKELAKIEIAKGRYPLYLFESNTSGEKMFEEFISDDEIQAADIFDNIGVIEKDGSSERASLMNTVKMLQEQFKSTAIDKKRIVEILKGTIQGFQHVETGFNLDQKM